MKRFFNDEPEPNNENFFFESDEEGNEFEDMSENPFAFIDAEDMIDAMNIDLAQSHLNQIILEKAIQLAESNFLWKFKSVSSKLEEVEKLYRSLKKLSEEEEKEEEPDADL